jgi:hypothetical protein
LLAIVRVQNAPEKNKDKNTKTGGSEMRKPKTTNEQIATGIVKVLMNENAGLQGLKGRIPKRFWDKVREQMGDDAPDQSTIAARWNGSSSGPQIRELVESMLRAPRALNGRESRQGQETFPDMATDPRVIEACADVDTDPSEDLDTSVEVNLNPEDLISLGVMTEPVENLDSIDLDATDSVDLYAHNAPSMVDTIDIETEMWPADISVVASDTIVVVNQLELRLSERLTTLAEDMETRLTGLVQTLVQDAVREALAAREPYREDGATERRNRGEGEAAGVVLRVKIDPNLFVLFDAECCSRYQGNVSDAMSAILREHYGKMNPSESDSAKARKSVSRGQTPRSRGRRGVTNPREEAPSK